MEYCPQGQIIGERAHGSLKTEFQKIKTEKLYPQMPLNALSHALFMLNFLNMSMSNVLWIDFGMMAQRQLLLKQGGETLIYDYKKDPILC